MPSPDERSDEALVGLLKSWGGTPLELLEDRAFLDAALPVLRTDLMLCDQYHDRPGRIRTPLMALAGSTDSTDSTAPATEVGAWSAYTGDWRGLRGCSPAATSSSTPLSGRSLTPSSRRHTR
jgi:surfactin synthase thioesterase subunit